MHPASSTRRILSIWLRRLSTDRIERRTGAPAETPRAVVATIQSARRITALNDAAARLNLRAGLALTDARAMYPALDVVEADPEADLALLDSIADWCDRYTPLVGLDRPDGLFLDITGCAHLFGGEAALCRDLWQRLREQGFRVRIAIADTPGAAWAMARYGNAGVVPAGNNQQALAQLSLAALRLEEGIAETLAQSGLKRIADILDLPRAPLAARFGKSLLRRLDQALGREEESIVPRLPVPPYVVEQRFPEPIAREDDVLATITHLSASLAVIMERQGEGARRLQTTLFRADGKVARVQIGTGSPLRDPVRIRKLFADRLAVLADECDPGFGFDVVRLSALASERLDPLQTGLGEADHAQERAHLIDRLGARFGARRVLRLESQDTHIPDYAMAEKPAAHRSGRTSQTLALSASQTAQDSLAPIRPIRLFARPEPVDVLATVPDGPPLRFRWRNVLHDVAQAEGPERIEMEWWRDSKNRKPARDYFRIENREGARMWLFREGLYERRDASPRWFLHGLFA